MKTYIALVGENGSGKGTFESLLKELLPQKVITRVVFSDVLRDTLKLWDIPSTRDNLQKLPQVMTEGFGKDALANAIRHRVSALESDIIILDGVRWLSD